MPDARSTEEGVREDLPAFVTLIERLSPYYESSREMAEALRLALDNTGQLRALMKLMAEPTGKR